MNTMETKGEKQSFEKAVQEFDRTSKLFRALMKYKAGIAELRQKRASFDFIRELLKENNVLVSETTLRRFVHQIIEPEIPKRRRRRSHSGSSSNGTSTEDSKNPGKAVSEMLTERRRDAVESWTQRRKGPRIADSKNL